jgi:hypothetical protein
VANGQPVPGSILGGEENPILLNCPNCGPRQNWIFRGFSQDGGGRKVEITCAACGSLRYITPALAGVSPPDTLQELGYEQSRAGAKERETRTRELPIDKAGPEQSREPMKDLILRLALAQDITLFTDQHGRPHCRIPRDDHYAIFPIEGSDFGDWLGYLLYKHDGRACSDKTLDPARRVLRAKAKFGSPVLRLANRTAWASDGALYYDLSDDKWQAVRITAQGWEIDPSPPILFRRYAHQAPQIMPERVRPEEAPQILSGLFDFVNLTGEANRLIYQVLVVSRCIPDTPHPIETLSGEQGSGKTFALKTNRRLSDPSDVLVLAVPWQSNEFVQQLAHHWCAFYDNLNSLTEWQQDILCRAVTGEGHTKRALYTDEEDIIFTYRRCIALNGINVVSSRPDLLDRSIIFELAALADGRRTEAELEADFERRRPRLLGAIFTVLVNTLRTDGRHAAALAVHFRLADWVAWSYRIAEALGNRGDEFLNAYAETVRSKALTALELHPLGKAIQTFMANRTEWKGTAQELLRELKPVAETEGINTAGNLWPGSASWVGRRLKEIVPDLRTIGITCDYDRGPDRREYRLMTA